jgi:hypothetical protein
MRHKRWIVTFALIGCRVDSGVQESGTTMETGTDTGTDVGTDTGTDVGTDTGEDDNCVPSPDWSLESLGSGRTHGIAVSADDTLHYLLTSRLDAGGTLRVSSKTYRERPAGGEWSAEDTFPEYSGSSDALSMVAHEGAIAVALYTDFGAQALQRSAASEWVLEQIPGTRLAYSDDGTLHAVGWNYARKPPGGSWEEFPLLEATTYGEVTVIDDVVHICAFEPPNLSCTSSASSFSEVEYVPGWESDESDFAGMSMAGSWLFAASGPWPTATSVTDFGVWRWDGSAWTEIHSSTTPGRVLTLHTHEDAIGNLHVTTASFQSDSRSPVRYFGFEPNGTVKRSWIVCDSTARTYVVGLSDGTPVVSFAADELVYLATAN